jgi:spore maturation protein CgeB
MHKKILIYGENWAGTLPQLLYSDLKERGVKVDIFDYTDIMPGIKTRHFFQKIMRRIFYQVYGKKINNKFLHIVKSLNPDVIIIAKGLNLNLSTLLDIKKLGIKLVNWNPDDFFNMKNSNDNLINSINAYDLIVSSRPHLFDKYYAYGANKMLFIDWYYVPDLHFSKNFEKTIKCSFVGSWSKYREEFVDSIGKPFFIRGGGWEKSSIGFKKRHDVDSKILTQREMSKLFDMSEVNLNILTPDNEDLSNLRFFEVPASGGMLLTERNAHSLKYLKDKDECLMYSSVEEIRDLLDGDLNFRAIASLGMQRILNENHSFRDRVDLLLKHIG